MGRSCILEENHVMNIIVWSVVIYFLENSVAFSSNFKNKKNYSHKPGKKAQSI